ncbi:MAG: S49 family peptidase [Gammaproteobacteria bacterium]|nr:S49 family peptidase [Gammaproteobacteria bacterium]
MSDQDDRRWTEGPEVPREKGGDEGSGPWAERQLASLLQASLREQRRTRRWGILFKSLFLAYLVAVLVLIQYDAAEVPDMASGRHTALVDLSGIIAADTDADADLIAGGLRKAFKDGRTAGVILRVNSPGGSPVQARYIYDEIRRLREQHPEIPLYAVIVDIGASGGYYVAAAADRIYASESSLVGSIGVRMDGFGLVEAIDKLGIERRLLTAGEDKGLLDPFLPVQPDQKAHVQGLLDAIHRQFIEAVRAGRGDRLEDDPAIFSGLIWTGEQGVELGLVDAIASSGQVAREVIGAEKIVDFTPRRDIWQRLVDRFGTVLAGALTSGGLTLR